jgi:phi13 family phage major tail protein
MSQNKVTFGLEKVHVAFFDTASQTQPAWEAPIAIPGAVRFSPEPQGEESTFYADNGPYFTYTSNNGYASELEMANIPDPILARMLGWEIDANGMLVETTDGEPEEFALLGQVLGDKKNRRFVYYRCKASRPNKEHSTRAESVEPATERLNIRILPIKANGKNIVRGVMELNDTNQAAYDAFFESVYLPNFSGTGGA